MTRVFNQTERNSKIAQARSLIARFQQRAPIDVKWMAGQLGINVWELSLPERISGKLFRDSTHGGSSGFSIGINASEGMRRKRFTIAHEIAHYLLHRDLITDGVLEDDTLYRSGLSTREEKEANQLAADILMPYRLINDLSVQGITSVSDLAKHFKVSQAAMQIRLNIPII
jgi:hypothetical protein